MPRSDNSHASKPAGACEKCGRARDDVRADPWTRLILCDPCWFSTDPAPYQRSH